jgi:hypothetical protein
MAHHEKLPAPAHRSPNKLQVNSSAGWYASGPDVVFSSSGVDRVIYGTDHTAYQRPILINDFDQPPEILSGGLLFKRSNDATLWWRTPENGDQPIINYPMDSAPVYKKFDTPGLFYTIDGVEYPAGNAQGSAGQSLPRAFDSQSAPTFPLVDTQPRDAATPSFAVGDSGMFLDSNGNLSFSVNKMLNTTMQSDGTIITDGYLFMDGHSLRSTPTELILTAGTHPVKINNGAIVARSIQSQTMQADAIKTAVLSAHVLAGKSGVLLTLGDKITCHTEMIFDTMPTVTRDGLTVPLSTYKPSLNLRCEPLTAGDFVCVNERGARRYTGGLVRNIDTFLLADHIFFKSNTEMLSVSGSDITYTKGGEQVHRQGAAIHAELYYHSGHLYRVSNTPVTALGSAPQACAVDQDAVLLITDGTLYIYSGDQVISSKIPLEADAWQILILPGYTGVISGSYFKIVFLYSGKITWGVPYADYQCASCISMTYNGKYNVLVSLEKTFLSDSYLQVLDITGLIINKVITRSAFSGVLDMAYNATTDSYCLVLQQDDQVLFKPFYYDGRDITFALTYSDRKIKTVISRITPAEDYFIFAYADDCLAISAFYDQRADIIGMALTDSTNGQCTVQTTGSVVQLPGELPARYVGKKIHLCNARPYPDNLKLSGGIVIGVCLDVCHLKI